MARRRLRNPRNALVWTVAQARRHGFGALVETEGKAIPFDRVELGFDELMYVPTAAS